MALRTNRFLVFATSGSDDTGRVSSVVTVGPDALLSL